MLFYHLELSDIAEALLLNTFGEQKKHHLKLSNQTGGGVKREKNKKKDLFYLFAID